MIPRVGSIRRCRDGARLEERELVAAHGPLEVGSPADQRFDAVEGPEDSIELGQQPELAGRDRRRKRRRREVFTESVRDDRVVGLALTLGAEHCIGLASDLTANARDERFGARRRRRLVTLAEQRLVTTRHGEMLSGEPRCKGRITPLRSTGAVSRGSEVCAEAAIIRRNGPRGAARALSGKP